MTDEAETYLKAVEKIWLLQRILKAMPSSNQDYQRIYVFCMSDAYPSKANEEEFECLSILMKSKKCVYRE